MTNEEYKPTKQDICDDPGCPCFLEPYVDRGYGYPVCPSSPERVGPDRIPMNLVFIDLEENSEAQ